MMKALYAFLAVATLASCGNSYDITGTSNVSMMDGQKLYLKVPKDDKMENVDSCDVVHGEFSFAGRVDSTSWGTIFMDDQGVLPVVLESGDITIKINDTQNTLGGTPLNDRLNQFLLSFDQIMNDAQTLSSRHSQYIMDGMSEEEANQRVAVASNKIDERIDDLVMKYVCDNFDNVLGPGIFLMVAQSLYPQPMLTPWVEDVMSKATPAFKNNPFVKEYYDAALQLQNEGNGMASSDNLPPAPDAAGTNNIPAAPTPNQMAGDSIGR